MLIAIVGWFYVLSGLMCLLKPEWLRGVLKRKGQRKLRWFFFGLALTVSLMIIKAMWGMPGILSKILLVLGVFGVFKAVFFLKAKAAETMIAWIASRPVMEFRVWAGVMIAFGAALLYLYK